MTEGTSTDLAVVVPPVGITWIIASITTIITLRAVTTYATCLAIASSWADREVVANGIPVVSGTTTDRVVS